MNEIQTIQNKIYEIRDQRVMLDFATSNNPGSQDVTNWKSQIATSNFIMMVLRKPPYAFTENGVARNRDAESASFKTKRNNTSSQP